LRWLLAGLTAVVYWQVSCHGFINYDDPAFVSANPHVYTGLSFANFLWAFTTLNGGATSYQPPTWLTHQLDCQLFGLQPGPQHLTNLWFHLANTLLLFGVMDALTKRPWRSGLVAALFALHPLHVETVAWISERKSLVCLFFWMLTTLAYVRYTRIRSVASYAPVLLLFAAALLSKPIAVSLPITLLLLDYWPLDRFRVVGEPAVMSAMQRPPGWTPAELAGQTAAVRPAYGGRGPGQALSAKIGGFVCGRPFLEKVPLFIATFVVCLVTVVAQIDLGATKSLADIPMRVRISNSIMACVLYLRKTIWPSDLAPIYPLRFDWPWWQVALCGLLLAAASLWVIAQTKKRQYLLVGWIWYLVCLVPTIGLVQVGSQGMADRYSYVPLIGIFIMAVWYVAEIIAGSHAPRIIPAVGASAVVGACAVCTFVTARYWQDSLGLFQHAILVTKGNYIACCQAGLAWVGVGNLPEAEKLFHESLRIWPNQPVAENCLGNLLFREGDCQGAFEHYSRAVKLKPRDAQLRGKLAELFIHSKDPRYHDPRRALEEAHLACDLSHYRTRELVGELALVCAENHDFREAREAARKALALSFGPQETQWAEKMMADVRRMEEQAGETAGQATAERSSRK